MRLLDLIIEAAVDDDFDPQAEYVSSEAKHKHLKRVDTSLRYRMKILNDKNEVIFTKFTTNTGARTVGSWITGIDKSDLISRNFIDSSGIFNFKFAHIVCGNGGVNVIGMTCSTCVPPCNDPGLESCDLASNPPSALTGTRNLYNISISWTDNSSGADSFIIMKSENGGAYFQISTVPAGVISFIDYAIDPSVNYTYEIIGTKHG